MEVVTSVSILIKTYQTVYLRTVNLAALYLNEVINIEKTGSVSSDNSFKLLGLEKEKRNKA